MGAGKLTSKKATLLFIVEIVLVKKFLDELAIKQTVINNTAKAILQQFFGLNSSEWNW